MVCGAKEINMSPIRLLAMNIVATALAVVIFAPVAGAATHDPSPEARRGALTRALAGPARMTVSKRYNKLSVKRPRRMTKKARLQPKLAAGGIPHRAHRARP